VAEAIAAGAVGFLLKDVASGDLLRAIREARHGRPFLHPEAQRHLMLRLRPAGAPGPLQSLTPREREVLALLGRGHKNRKIATALGIAEGTVKGYVSAVLLKLGVTDRTQAALLAVREGVAAR
jgi:DNA-binding NarL/FixJ family response regulator